MQQQRQTAAPIVQQQRQTAAQIVQRPPTQQARTGPTLVPVGITMPVGLTVGKTVQTQPRQQTIPIVATQTVQTQPARSPAQWKQLPTLM